MKKINWKVKWGLYVVTFIVVFTYVRWWIEQ